MQRQEHLQHILADHNAGLEISEQEASSKPHPTLQKSMYNTEEVNRLLSYSDASVHLRPEPMKLSLPFLSLLEALSGS